MEGMGLILTSVLVRHLLGSLGLSETITSTSLTHNIGASNSPIIRYSITHFGCPSISTTHPLICTIHDIIMVVKIVAQNSAVLCVAIYYG